MNHSKLISTFTLLILLTSCSRSLTQLGFQEPKKLTDNEILEIAEGKFKIENGVILKIDKVKFDTLLNSLNNSELSQDLFQPLQFRYYDKQGNLKVLYANCDVPYKKVKGKIEWYWNKYGTFDNYPPQNPVTKEYLDGFNIRDEIESYIPLQTKELEFDNSKPTIIVFWANEWDKHARELVEFVEEYIKISEPVNLFYINTD